MYTATTQITITQFVPMTGVVSQSPCIQATIAAPINTSPQPDGQPPVFSGSGQSIRVTVPAGYLGSTALTFQLPDSRYVLLGVAFHGPRGGAGRLEFRTVVIDRDPASSQLTVTDACMPQLSGVDYTYVILVQEVATGNIGLIDPDIETDINE